MNANAWIKVSAGTALPTDLQTLLSDSHANSAGRPAFKRARTSKGRLNNKCHRWSAFVLGRSSRFGLTPSEAAAYLGPADGLRR